MPKYEFTNEEVVVLKQMIDLAVRQSGMQGAEAAVVLTKKLDIPIVEETIPPKKDKDK